MNIYDSFTISSSHQINSVLGRLTENCSVGLGQHVFAVNALVVAHHSQLLRDVIRENGHTPLDILTCSQPHFTPIGLQLAIDFMHSRAIRVEFHKLTDAMAAAHALGISDMVHALELKILQLSEHPQTALIALEMAATGNLHDDNKKAVLLNCLTLMQELIHNPSFCATSELGLKSLLNFAFILESSEPRPPIWTLRWPSIVDAVVAWSQVNSEPGNQLLGEVLDHLPIDRLPLMDLREIIATSTLLDSPSHQFNAFKERLAVKLADVTKLVFATENQQLYRGSAAIIRPTLPCVSDSSDANETLASSPSQSGFSDYCETGSSGALNDAPDYIGNRIRAGVSNQQQSSVGTEKPKSVDDVTSYNLSSATSDHDIVMDYRTPPTPVSKMDSACSLVPFDFDFGELPPNDTGIWDVELLLQSKKPLDLAKQPFDIAIDFEFKPLN
ncbi:unnamed protein product, partial [Mesorhabditis belari]|uniref:BTB domain-containing protein n=1 Tax=Mesorhabditis belari TaxID=2138241 RepID=A0AAF3F3I0_9BILA